MAEKDITLTEIVNQDTTKFGSKELDNGNPYSWAKAKPMEFTQDVEELTKNYTITPDQIRNYLSGREASTLENIGSGLVQVGSQIREAGAGLDITFDKYISPNMTEEEAGKIMELAVRNLEVGQQSRSEMLQREGIGGFAFQASNVIGQAALSALAGVITGGSAAPIIAGGIQEFGRKAGEYSVKYAQETGDYSLQGQSAKDDLIALAYAGVSTVIEAGIGAERVLNGLIAKGALKQTAKAALGEATEEFLQEYAEYAADSVAGYNERGDLEVFKDALTGAVFGALGGGVMGFGMYYANKGKLTELFTRQGFDTATAKSMATEALDSAKEQTINELITRDQLQKHYGEKYDALKAKIDNTITNVGGLSFLSDEQRANYIETNAADLARQIMVQAAIFKTDTDSILNLSDVESIGNRLVLNTPDMHDQVVLRQRIADKKEQLKALRETKTQKKAQKLGVEGETIQESQLNLQIKSLQDQIKRLDEQDLIETKTVARKNKGVDVVQQAMDAGKGFTTSASVPTQSEIEGWLAGTPRTYRQWFGLNKIPQSVRASLTTNASRIKDIATVDPDVQEDLKNAVKRIANGLTMDNFAEMMANPTRDAHPFKSAAYAYLLLSNPDVTINSITSYSERLQAQQTYKNGVNQTSDDIMSQVIKENTPDKWNTDGTTDDKALLMLYEQKTLQSKSSTIAAIRGGDVNYISAILQANGIKTRSLSGTQIKEIARMNWQWFIGQDVGVSAGRNAQRIALNAIEENVVSGDMILLRNGFTQKEIDAMDDATWSKLVRDAYRKEAPQQVEAQPDWDAIPDDLMFQTDVDYQSGMSAAMTQRKAAAEDRNAIVEKLGNIKNQPMMQNTQTGEILIPTTIGNIRIVDKSALDDQSVEFGYEPATRSFIVPVPNIKNKTIAQIQSYIKKKDLETAMFHEDIHRLDHAGQSDINIKSEFMKDVNPDVSLKEYYNRPEEAHAYAQQNAAQIARNMSRMSTTDRLNVAGNEEFVDRMTNRIADYYEWNTENKNYFRGLMEDLKSYILNNLTDAVYYQTEQDSRELVVYHKISANNLNKALDLGGLPVPSIAITKASQEFGDFGDITLVGNKEMIDPANPLNEVYNRDVWSKTFPVAAYNKVKSAKLDSFRKQFRDIFNKAGDSNTLSSLIYTAQAKNPVNAVSEFENSNGAKLDYVENVLKRDVEIPMESKARFSMPFLAPDAKFIESIAQIDNYQPFDVWSAELETAVRNLIDTTDFGDKFPEKFREAANNHYFQDDGHIPFGIADRLVYDAKRYMRDKDSVEVDTRTLRDNLDKIINEDYDAYYNWALKTIQDSLVGEPMIQIGKKLIPWNMDNIVAYMIDGATKTGQDSLVYGTGKVIAAGAKRLESIADIKMEGKNIITDAEAKEMIRPINDSIMDFSNEFMTSNDFTTSMNQKEGALVALGETAALKNPTKESLHKKLKKLLPEGQNITDEILDTGMQIISDVKNLARDYFEAKPQRAVGIEEFTGAIIPTSSEFDAVADRLSEKGLLVVRNDNQVEGAKEFEHVFFQGKGKHLAGFDPTTKSIILSKNMNTGSLPHEMAHFWLQEMFNRSQGKTDLPESARASWAELSRILGITADQVELTQDQHEKFANLTEAYIFNKTALPAGTEPVIKDYMEFVPEKYNSFLDMGWIDGNGNVQNPILNEDSKRWFDAYYSGIGLSGDAPTMTKFAVSDEPAKKNIQTERQELLDTAHNQIMKTREDAENVIEENLPAETRQQIVDKIQDYDTAAQDFLAVSENTDDINDKKRSVWQKTMDLLHAGRGTDTREETMQKVNDWVKNHWDEALAIAKLNPNYYTNPTEIPTSLLIRAVAEQNTDMSIKDLLRANFAMAKSLEMKTGGLNNDTHDSMFLVGLGRIQNNLNQAYALKRFGASRNATARVEAEINKFCERYASDVMSGRKSWQDIMALAASEFGNTGHADSQVLSQTQLPSNASKQDFIKYMKHLIKVQAGAEMTGEQIAKFNEIATAAQIASTDLDSDTESVYRAAAATLRRYQDFVAESVIADNWFDKVAGQYFSRAMLSGLTTQTKNLVGNKFENWIVRAAIASKYGKSTVSTEVITKERNRLTDIYETSLLSIPQMENLSDPTLVHGEGYGLSENSVNLGGIRIQTLGKTAIPDPLAMLGRSDFYFRREVYLATLAARASKYAKENNLDADTVFKEFKKLSTTNMEASDARKEAIILGHTAVFTQDGSLAQALNKVRRVMNEMLPLGHRYGLGNLIAPFTKTPSNIVEMGAKALASPFTSVYELATTKQLSIQHRVDLGNLAGALLLFAATAALTGDYEPPYKVGQKYDPNKHYDCINIRGFWIKLDSFGAMETPLRLLLASISTAKGAWPRVVAGTFAQIPVDLGKLEYAITNPAKGGASFVEGEIDKFIPTIASDAAKAFGHQSGIVLDSPYLIGNKTIRKLGIDGTEPSVNDWIRLIGGGIIQVDNR